MKTEAQDKRWNELSEESKKFFIKRYNMWDAETDNGRPRRNEFEQVFGIHNLNPKPVIKEWKDVEEYHTNIDLELGKATQLLSDYSHCSIQLLRKCIATLKIAKLIELGYGGMVSEEENNDTKIKKYAPLYYGEKGFVIECLYRLQDRVLCFHTKQQVKEFMSYESNRKLVEQYYMM